MSAAALDTFMSAGARLRRLAAPLAQLAGAGRRLSSSSTDRSSLPTFKAALRAVYKQVHPDLFQDYLPAKDANTKSFKMLHEYLEAARSGSRVPLPYRFHFFVRSSSSSGRSTAGSAPPPTGVAAAGAPPGLREVVLTLPPPTRGAPGEPMSGSTRKAFSSLLAALGLPPGFAGEDEGAEGGSQYNRFVSLREFLPQAVEAVHQAAATQSGAQIQLSALRTALRLGRRVVPGFGEPQASAGVLQQLPLLQRLVATLDSLSASVDLAGLKVTIGGQASGVDALGTVWLAADGSQEAWARHLSSVDAGQCRQRQQLLQAVRAQEAATAQLLGVAMLYTQQDASLAAGYREALERLAAAAAGRGPVGGGRFRELPIMLCPEEPGTSSSSSSSSSAAPSSGSRAGTRSSSGSGSSSSSGELGGCTADSAAGLLTAPVGVPADALYAAVQQLGGQVLAALGRRRQQEAELAALRTQVERKVMLRRLLRDPAISDARFKSCLDRMLGSAQKLSGLLHGTAVRVTEVNSLSPDRAVINIAWNWQM